ncbi:hypothetical protein E4U43_002137 [Claviceps pusilla]|uniref:Uncharacterized protein n=1 Tax=Claviceps pusilla TaxID=123648 RepID=A0A9P7N951_9HYPO|nr:hypothetical protein E4U43_002137 [Claviceps pusilla]
MSLHHQRTFTLIPPPANIRGDAPDRRLSAQHVRPMTSKQAQKAYKASTRTPPVSRAEQLRRDRAEQERIRKEFEKEKATAKARLARERKKEKESAEREQKKKKGVPLVTVRPSQDTIARFVRGNGSGKKRTCAGGLLEEMGGCDGGGGGGGKEEVVVSGPDRCGGERVQTEPRATLSTGSAGTRELDLIPEEEGDDIEQDIDSGLEELLDAISRDQCGVKHQQADEGHVAKTGPPSGPPRRVPLEEEAVMTSPLKPPSLSPTSRPPRPPRPPYMLQAPTKEKSSEPPPSPPMSTQAILGNLEDFFPSSSQQARELQDDALPEPHSHPSPSKHHTPSLTTHASKPLTPSPPPPRRQRFFTPSGTNELVSLAIQRSRRTAAIHQPQRPHGLLSQSDILVNTTRAGNLKHPPKPLPTPAQKTPGRNPDSRPCNAITTTTSFSAEKENVQPQVAPPRIDASQESEYGGDWIDDLALDLIM